MKLVTQRIWGPVEVCVYLDVDAFGLGLRVRWYDGWFATASLGPLLFTAGRSLAPPPARGPHSSH